MHRRTLLCFLTLMLFATAYSQDNQKTEEIIDLTDITISAEFSNEVFFQDPERKVYYVDFEATKTKVSQIQIWKNLETLVLNENTDELPFNTIYEISFEKYEPGEYSIEVTTVDEDVIIQMFVVKSNVKQVVKKEKK